MRQPWHGVGMRRFLGQQNILEAQPFTLPMRNEILSHNVRNDLTNKCSKIFVLSLGFCLEISNFPSMGSAFDKFFHTNTCG